MSDHDEDEEIRELTDKQKKALQDATDILSESFDSILIAVRAADERLNDSIVTDYHGPITDILGLAQISKLRIERKILDNRQDE
jgi:hypothetical protein